MVNILASIFLFITGAAVGSFACCQVWRIRKNDKSKRSHCMNCKYQLKWYDNVPILSWLLLGGKCRKCHKKIGVMELLAEIFTGVVFLTTYWLWPEYKNLIQGDAWQIALFSVFLITLIFFAIMFIYDAKWKELPVSMLYSGIGCGVIFAIINCIRLGGVDWLSMLGSLLVLPGFYFLMYKVSRESWVGEGDYILCIPLALMLGNFWLSACALFVSNLVGCLVMMPFVMGKKKHKILIPFGPFLIIGFLTVYFAQNFILSLVVF